MGLCLGYARIDGRWKDASPQSVAGPDHYEVRRGDAWHRCAVIVLSDYVSLAVIRFATVRKEDGCQKGSPRRVNLPTAPEVRRLVFAVTIAEERSDSSSYGRLGGDHIKP